MIWGGGGGWTGVPWYLIFDYLVVKYLIFDIFGGQISDIWFFKGGLISDIWFFMGFNIWYLVSSIHPDIAIYTAHVIANGIVIAAGTATYIDTATANVTVHITITVIVTITCTFKPMLRYVYTYIKHECSDSVSRSKYEVWHSWQQELVLKNSINKSKQAF